MIDFAEPALVYDENGINLDLETPEAFDFLYDPPLGEIRYRVAYGGRGKGSSWQIARALLVHGMERPLRILCTREYQSSIKESVHKVLSSQIDALGLGDFYHVQDNTIFAYNGKDGAVGTEFIFKGIRKDIASIKSTEAIDICWVEEAESVTEESWRILIPTIRKSKVMRMTEIWVSFNPLMETDATYQRFVVKTPKRAIVRKINWRDNPFFSEELRYEKDEMEATDPDAYDHVWEGNTWSRSDAQVLNGKWVVEDFTPVPGLWNGPYYGGDWGFANDPSTLMRVWIFDGDLYIEAEAGGPLMDNDALERMYREMQGELLYEVLTDPARPETINELRLRGLNVRGAETGPGSVEDGINHLRSYRRIVIHSTCYMTKQEARLWRFKLDPRTKQVLPILQKGNDHRWDAIRYALSPLIRRRMKPGIISGDDDD